MESNLENSNVSMNHRDRKDFDSDSRRNNGRFRGEKRAHRDDSRNSSSSRSSRSSCGKPKEKVPFIYYASTFIAQNYFFSSKQRRFSFRHYILTNFSSCSLKGVFSKPSGNLILGPDFCLLSYILQILATCLFFHCAELCQV